MISGEKWSMGSEAVGGGRRRLRRHRQANVKQKKSEYEPLVARGLEIIINGTTRLLATRDIAANEDLLRSTGNNLSEQQKIRLRKGVPAFKLNGVGYDEVRFEESTWMFSFGQKDLADTSPVEMYRAKLCEGSVTWERQIIGVDAEFMPFEPSLDDVKIMRGFAEDAAKVAQNS